MKKVKLFSGDSILITLKAIAVSFILGLVGMLLNVIRLNLPEMVRPVFALIMVVWIVFSLFLWGYIANRFWKWK